MEVTERFDLKTLREGDRLTLKKDDDTLHLSVAAVYPSEIIALAITGDCGTSDSERVVVVGSWLSWGEQPFARTFDHMMLVEGNILLYRSDHKGPIEFYVNCFEVVRAKQPIAKSPRWE